MAISYNIPSAPAASRRIVINNTAYFIKYLWSTRSKCWYIDFSTADDVYLAKNAKLVPNVKLLRSNLHLLPTGNFYVVADTASQFKTPGRSNIGPGKDFRLLYITNEELANA